MLAHAIYAAACGGFISYRSCEAAISHLPQVNISHPQSGYIANSPFYRTDSVLQYYQEVRIVYNWRHIKCPQCNHVFVWIEDGCCARPYYIYRRKGQSEMLLSTRCPKCNCRMVVPSDSPTGICVDDENIEEIGCVEGGYIF